MIEIGFKKIELEDKDLITHYFKHHTGQKLRAYICECIFMAANLSCEVC